LAGAGAVLKLCFKNEIERRLGGAPETAKAAFGRDLFDPQLASLGTERETNFL